MDAKLSVVFLNVRNPAYDGTAITQAEAFYYGGKRFDALKRDLLYKKAADNNPNYLNQRLQGAEYTDHIGGILDFFRATTFQSPPKLVFSLVDDPVQELVEKVNATSATLSLDERQAYELSKLPEINKLADAQEKFAEQKLAYYNTLNEGLTDLLSGRMLDMMLAGYGLLTASFPANPIPGQVPNRDVQLKLGLLDAKFCYLCVDEVVDWEQDDMGKLQWLKTYCCSGVRSVPYGPLDDKLHTWTYYFPDRKVIYEKLQKAREVWTDETKVFADKKSETPNSLGLPIFECSLPDRACLMDRVMGPARSLFNREADIDFALRMQCYAQPWYAGEKKAEELCSSANEFALWMLNKDEKCGYIIPPDVAFDALATSADTKKQNLIAATNAAAIDLLNVDQHAKGPGAIALDRNPIEALLAFYAYKLRCAVMEAVEYVIRARGDEDVVTFKLLGMDLFSPAALAQKIANGEKFLALPIGKTAKKIVKRDLAHRATPNATAAEAQIIDREVEDEDYSTVQSYAVPPAAGAAPGKSPPPPSGADEEESSGDDEGDDTNS